MVHGDPNRPVHAWACGHMVDDAHPDVSRMERRPSTPAQFKHEELAYWMRTKDRANAVHATLIPGCALGTVATRDIAAGQEVLVCYGYLYWTQLDVRSQQLLSRHDARHAQYEQLMRRITAWHPGFPEL